MLGIWRAAAAPAQRRGLLNLSALLQGKKLLSTLLADNVLPDIAR